MPFLTFLFETVLISLTGVMAPGPMTAATVGKGSESARAGALISVGHGVIELPLMLLLYFGLGAVLGHAEVRVALGIAGGLFMLVMGGAMLWGLRRTVGSPVAAASSRSPLLTGVVLSGGNPYFILWWVTVGGALIARAAPFGLPGFGAFAVVHWLCDLVWLSCLSALAYKGGELFGKRFRSAVTLISGLFLLFFGYRFLADAAVSLGGG
jgi:threonine/homoserine/homoserine lactone efflux protein